MPGGRRPSLDRAFRDLVRLHLRPGRTRKLSLDEAVARSRSLSRRRFLFSVAATGATLAGCRPSSPRASSRASFSGGREQPRVVIVGAGLAGLTAAYRLQQAGVRGRVFEARERVGGRCWSSTGWSGGQVGEHGGEFVDTRHVHLRGLVEELGLALDDLWDSWDPSSTSLSWVDGGDVDRRALFTPLRAAAGELAEVARRNGSYLAGEAGPAAVRFDQRTAADWFVEATGQPLDSALGRLFSSGQAGWWGLDLDALGATNMIDNFAVDWPGSDERYTVHGGNDQVSQRLAAELPAGALTLDAPLEVLRRTTSGGYELEFAGQPGPVAADVVVLTLPYTALREVDLTEAGLSRQKQAVIDRLGMGTNSKVLVQFDRPLAHFGDWSGSCQRGDDPQFGTWESGSTDSGRSRYSLLTVYAGGVAGTDYPTDRPHGPAPPAVTDRTLTALDEMRPGLAAAAAGTPWLDFWAQDPWVRGSYAALLPGQTTKFWGHVGDAEHGVHFAGEHTSVYSQGYLNGGVESGGRAAAEILDELGVPYPDGLSRAQQQARRYQPVYPWS